MILSREFPVWQKLTSQVTPKKFFTCSVCPFAVLYWPRVALYLRYFRANIPLTSFACWLPNDERASYVPSVGIKPIQYIPMFGQIIHIDGARFVLLYKRIIGYIHLITLGYIKWPSLWFNLTHYTVVQTSLSIFIMIVLQ